MIIKIVRILNASATNDGEFENFKSIGLNVRDALENFSSLNSKKLPVDTRSLQVDKSSQTHIGAAYFETMQKKVM